MLQMKLPDAGPHKLQVLDSFHAYDLLLTNIIIKRIFLLVSGNRPNVDTEYNTDETQLFPDGLPGRDDYDDTSVLKNDDRR